jgi:hypothetical protein
MSTSGWESSSDSWSSDLYDEDFLVELGEHEAGDVGMHMGEGDGDRRLRSLDDTILLANLDRYVVISESMNTRSVARPKCKTNPQPYVCSLSSRFEADPTRIPSLHVHPSEHAVHSWFLEAPGGVASPRRISSLPMRRYGTEILADPLMETNDDDRTLVEFDIPEGVEDIKRVKPSLRFTPAMEQAEILENKSLNIDTFMDVVQSPPEGISSSGQLFSKGMGKEKSKMEDSDLYGEDEDYSCAELDEDDEDAKVNQGLMYALGGVAFFALLSFVAKKLLACFERVNQGNDNDLNMIVDNADQFADLAHMGEAMVDATSLAQTSASNASMNASTSNSIGAVGGAANNPASSAAAAQ